MKCKDGFDAERIRKKLLEKKKYHQLLETYSNKYPSIPDRNSGVFWDKRFEEKNQKIHYMEEDRLRIVANTVKKDEKVLDLGVGKGKLEDILFRKFGNNIQLFATDITQSTLKSLKARYKFWNFSNQKLEKLKFKDNFFERVFLLEVLEHIKPTHTFKVLKEIRRVLEIGGKFVISVPINEGLEEMYPENPNSHVRVYSEELIRFEIENEGFEIINVIRLTAFPNFYFLKKILNQFFNLRKPNNLIFICQKKA